MQSQRVRSLFDAIDHGYQWCLDHDIDIPADVQIGMELARSRMIDLGGAGSGFYGHRGRDAENKQGGSIPRDAGDVDDSPPAPDMMDWPGYEHVGGDDYRAGVYKINDNAQWIAHSTDDALLMVGLTGEHKGEILITEANLRSTSHTQMLKMVYPESSVDDWAHFYNRTEDGKKTLVIGMSYAGVEWTHLTDESEFRDKAFKNIYRAGDYLKRKGLNADYPLWVYYDSTEPPVKTSLENFALGYSRLRDLGGAGSGFYGHRGRDAENKQGGSIPRSAPGPGADVAKSIIGLARKKRAKAQEDEKVISPILVDIAEENEVEFKGYGERLKSESSLAGKIELNARTENLTHEQAAEQITDVNRYTMIAPSHKMVDVVKKTRQKLTDAGFERYDHKLRNYFGSGGQYEGYNTVWTKPETGATFELQFHTPESFTIKELNHSDYEKFRIGDVSMIDLAENVFYLEAFNMTMQDRYQDPKYGYTIPLHYETLENYL